MFVDVTPFKRGWPWYLILGAAMLQVHPTPKVFAEIIQKPEANHGLPAQHILRDHRGLRAMLLSDFESCSDQTVQDGFI
jgi:hypothetical protein